MSTKTAILTCIIGILCILSSFVAGVICQIVTLGNSGCVVFSVLMFPVTYVGFYILPAGAILYVLTLLVIWIRKRGASAESSQPVELTHKFIFQWKVLLATAAVVLLAIAASLPTLLPLINAPYEARQLVGDLSFSSEDSGLRMKVLRQRSELEAYARVYGEYPDALENHQGYAYRYESTGSAYSLCVSLEIGKEYCVSQKTTDIQDLPERADGTPYIDTEFGYQITYPEGWVRAVLPELNRWSEKGGLWVGEGYAPPEDIAFSTRSLNRVGVEIGSYACDSLASCEAERQERFRYKDAVIADITVNGKEALSVKYTTSDWAEDRNGNAVYTVLEIITIHNGKSYIAFAALTPDLFKKYEQEVRASLATFKIVE